MLAEVLTTCAAPDLCRHVAQIRTQKYACDDHQSAQGQKMPIIVWQFYRERMEVIAIAL